ncbi:MAG: hypothetical protein ACHBN1_04985 [Heteroscytonema crispum UTEX LB 1556]
MGRWGDGEMGTTGVRCGGQGGYKQPRDRASPVAWVGKTPLRPLGRPQDRSGSPTKGAPSPPTPAGFTSTRRETLPQYALHHQPITNYSDTTYTGNRSLLVKI